MKLASHRTDWRRHTLALAITTATLALFGSGCTITEKGTPAPRSTRMTVGVTTKAQVYDQLGVPTEIAYDGKESILVYRLEKGRGLTLGGGYGMMPLLLISHTHVGTDVFAIRIGADNKVASVRGVRGSDLVSYALWPFGD